jgi:deoxyribose-phosphate aldolase
LEKEEISVTLNIQELGYQQVAKLLDHALLRPEMTETDALVGCQLAKQYDIAAVSVKPCYLPLVVRELEASDVAAGTVVSFPHGHSTTPVKIYEALNGVDNGAVELDIVMNIGALRSGAYEYVVDEVSAIVEAVNDRALVKVILENHYLTRAQIVKACELLEQSGVNFVKTATGYADTGASAEDVRLMRTTVSPAVQVKAAGGIRTLADVLAVVAAGAARVGTSATAAILDEFLAKQAE